MSSRITRWLLRTLAAVAVLVLLVAVCGALYQALSTSSDLRRYPPPGKMVDVGGHELHLYCSGSGRPVVVLDSPMGSSFLGWSLVQPLIAQRTRVCSYDRAGYGWSEPGPLPRTARRIVSELRTLLSDAGEEGPYVLVGSSVGGCHVRLWAAEDPGEVSGMVLVDSAREDQLSRLPGGEDLVAQQLHQLMLFRIASHLGLMRLEDVPIGEASAGILSPEIEPAARAAGFRSAWADAIYHETAAIEESFAQVREAVASKPGPLLDDKPLIVLSRGPSAGASPEEAGQEKIWDELQKEFLTESTRATRTVVEGSGHFIQTDRPEAVAGAILDVLQQARGESSVSSPSPP
ncbi:MAG TPA: alpha/beta hydrolase [Candidatus Saccharimonadales bacterium]|nr:alpha/beta hydrolase [Candidatus Saccharimonadales bacterium]